MINLFYCFCFIVRFFFEVLYIFFNLIFFVFKCNLAPPDGIRGIQSDDTDEIEENEEPDRVRYKETLGKLFESVIQSFCTTPKDYISIEYWNKYIFWFELQ